MDKGQNCDPVTGVCEPASLGSLETKIDEKYKDAGLIYVGDPMCSWCWGIAPALKELRDHYKPKGIGFDIVVGGLRPGGGDPWDDQMKDFLKHHWQEVTARSGQTFGYELFDKESFHYDTEPPCRAAVAARPFVKGKELEFFTALKHKFYVLSEDPNEEVFYESICQDFGIDFNDFLERFRSEEVRKETHDEFLLNRNWGVKGYPAVILKKGEGLYSVAQGFSSFEQMQELVENILSDEKVGA